MLNCLFLPVVYPRFSIISAVRSNDRHRSEWRRTWNEHPYRNKDEGALKGTFTTIPVRGSAGYAHRYWSCTEDWDDKKARAVVREDSGLGGHIRHSFAYNGAVPERWCTVTVTDKEGRRHSLDVNASSTYDAAHLYFTHAKSQPASGLPVPTVATVFEVVIAGNVHRIEGAKLKLSIAKRREEWKGPRGLLFSRRPTLD